MLLDIKWLFFFSQDGKMEHKLSDIFYNSHQMFHSKQIILNNQGLCKTRHHVHEYGWSSRHPRFKISEAQPHTLPAGHFCQQRTFALRLGIRCENREPPKPFGLPLAMTDPPPHPAFAYLHPTRLWHQTRAILSVLFRSCILRLIWHYLGLFMPDKLKKKPERTMFGGHLYACGGTSLVLVYRVALWPWTITCPRPALSILVFPGMLNNIALPICFWDEPLWLRRPCSLTCFSPFHSQAMGKKDSRDPCRMQVPRAPQKRVGAATWLFFILHNVLDSWGETVGDRPWKTPHLRHRGLVQLLVKAGNSSSRVAVCLGHLQRTPVTTGSNNKSHIITFLEGTNTFFFPLFSFFSTFFQSLQIPLCTRRAVLLLVTQESHDSVPRIKIQSSGCSRLST